MKIQLLAVIPFFIPATLLAQVPVIRSPATAGVPNVEQSASTMPINVTLGKGEHPQTLQFAEHTGIFQNAESSAPVLPTQVERVLPEPIPASQILNQLDGKKGDITNLQEVDERSLQAQAQIDAASSQVEGAKIQAGAQGANQTQQLAEQLRQSASSVAQDMQSIVSSTKEVSEVQNSTQAQISPQATLDSETVTSNLRSSTFRQPNIKNSGNYDPDTATKPSPSGLQIVRPPNPSAVGY